MSHPGHQHGISCTWVSTSTTTATFTGVRMSCFACSPGASIFTETRCPSGPRHNHHGQRRLPDILIGETAIVEQRRHQRLGSANTSSAAHRARPASHHPQPPVQRSGIAVRVTFGLLRRQAGREHHPSAGRPWEFHQAVGAMPARSAPGETRAATAVLDDQGTPAHGTPRRPAPSAQGQPAPLEAPCRADAPGVRGDGIPILASAGTRTASPHRPPSRLQPGLQRVQAQTGIFGAREPSAGPPTRSEDGRRCRHPETLPGVQHPCRQGHQRHEPDVEGNIQRVKPGPPAQGRARRLVQAQAPSPPPP